MPIISANVEAQQSNDFHGTHTFDLEQDVGTAFLESEIESLDADGEVFGHDPGDLHASEDLSGSDDGVAFQPITPPSSFSHGDGTAEGDLTRYLFLAPRYVKIDTSIRDADGNPYSGANAPSVTSAVTLKFQ